MDTGSNRLRGANFIVVLRSERFLSCPSPGIQLTSHMACIPSASPILELLGRAGPEAVIDKTISPHDRASQPRLEASHVTHTVSMPFEFDR